MTVPSTSPPRCSPCKAGVKRKLAALQIANNDIQKRRRENGSIVIQKQRRPTKPVGEPWPIHDLRAFDAPTEGEGDGKISGINYGPMLREVLKARGWRYSTNPCHGTYDGYKSTFFVKEFEASLRGQKPEEVFGKKARTTDGCTPLYMAAQNGHVDAVHALLEQNADPNIAKTTTGSTPLYMAAQKGHVDAVRVLLEHHADPNLARTDIGTTPLFIAAYNGHVDAMRVLLEQNADPNLATTDNGETPMFIAAQKGHLDTVKALAEAGGTTGTVLTSNGATDLWAACWQGHVDVVRYLVAQPTVEINRRRSDARGADGAVGHPGTTPLEVAVLEGHTAVAALLRQHGATA